MSICNFRCKYCYLAQRDVSFQGEQIVWKYSPDFIRKAYSKDRLGGECYFNLCADGETLLVKDFDKYVRVLLEEGHLVEIVTNGTITPVIDKLLSFERSLLTKMTFKCSFHYLELKEKKLLDAFAKNLNNIWNAGASATVEMVASDIYLPYLDEIKEYSLKNFGALPHITIPRNDRKDKEVFSELSLQKFYETWDAFNSKFFEFKKDLYNVKRKEFCYSGCWSLHVDFSTGLSFQCYRSDISFNIYDDITKPIPWTPIGACKQQYCYNGHSLLAVGLIPSLKTPKYGSDIRNRYNSNTGKNWYNDEALAFLDSKLSESNEELSSFQKRRIIFTTKFRRSYYRFLRRIKRNKSS